MADYPKPPIVKGAVFFYTQRVDGRPFVNCNPYSLTMVLRWMGYNCPKDYGMTLRKASGVPVAEHKGTSISDMKRALRVALPSATPVFTAWNNGDLWNVLPRSGRRNRGKMVVEVFSRMHQLPRRLRRWCGYDWVGMHACVIAGKRICNGEDGGQWHSSHSNVQEVYWMDPMGKPSEGYSGEWWPFADIAPTLFRNSEGAVKLIAGVKNSAA